MLTAGPLIWLALGFQQVVHPVLTEKAERFAEASDSEENRMNIHKNARLTPRGGIEKRPTMFEISKILNIEY